MSTPGKNTTPQRANPPNIESTSLGPDLENQVTSTGSGGGTDGRPHVPNVHAAGSYNSQSHRNSMDSKEECSPSLQQGSSVNEENGGEGSARTPNNETQAESAQGEWKPWRLDEPYRSKVSKDDQAIENLVKAMKESDDGMCKGWTDQIDTLIIFAGLFSATVTAFAVESYQWLAETPADTLARLQLRALLNEAHDLGVDRLAPATFTVSTSEVLINTLWFSSLTLALAAVVVSILCKQWLYEYQRYDNFTTADAFLVRGLRYRGLQAWRVPMIIASLPVLLQVALVLFLIGVLVLLWPLQTILASIVTVIVGAIFLFLGMTTILPAIQYIHPMFPTQCAYKSSQSWSFLSITTFWLFDLSLFTNWAVFDRWEVTCVCADMGHTLFRAYELLSNRVDAFQSIYTFLADTSLTPISKADLTLLSDFAEGLDAARRDEVIQIPPPISEILYPNDVSMTFQRIRELKNYIIEYYNPAGRLKPVSHQSSGFVTIAASYTGDKSHLRAQHQALSQLLRDDVHIFNPEIFNRYVEHLVRCLDNDISGNEEGAQQGVSSVLEEICGAIYRAQWEHIHLDPDIASHLVDMFSHLLKTDRASGDAIKFLSMAYSGFVKSYQQHHYDPPPYTLLKDIRDWISRIPESDLVRKAELSANVLFSLVDFLYEIVVASNSGMEEQSLRSFLQFFVAFYEGDVIQTEYRQSIFEELTDKALANLRNYLHKHSSASS